jgi:outer membrane protein TolC
MVSLSGFPAAAQAPAAAPGGTSLLDRPARVGISLTQHKLSLQEALELALRNNLEIQIERTSTAAAHQAVNAARGFYDPVLRFQPGWDARATPTGSVLQGPSGKLDERYFSQNFYFRQPLGLAGSRVGADFENTRLTTTNPFTSFNPLFNSRLALSFTQPLLRNRLIDQPRTELMLRRKAVDISDTDFELKVIDVVLRVEQAYWDLVAARQDVQVRADSAEWARQQLAINQRMVHSGNLAPVEISAAEAELERRLDSYYASVGTVTEVENNLKMLLAPERAAPIWGDEIVPADDRLRETPPADELAEAVGMALKNRPELRRVGQQMESVGIQKTYAAELRKPQVDLVAAYVNSGLGGTVSDVQNPFSAAFAPLFNSVNQLLAQQGLPAISTGGLSGSAPPLLVGGYGTALSNLFSGRYQGFQAGLSVDFNLRNRSAEANYSSALIGEKRLKLERMRAEQFVEAQVRNALQGIQTARQRRAAAEASAKAAREKLDSEMRLYQVGESTNFLVLTRQNEFADSRRRVVVAELDYNKSVSRLEQAVGMTLAAHKINVK